MEKTRELATENPAKLLLKYSWPALVAMTLSALYSVVDRLYIGRGCGEAAMAGLTLNFPVMMLFGAFGVFVGAGHAAVLSIKLGAGDRTACEKILGQMVAFKLVFFFILPPLVFFNADTVLGWCGGGRLSPQALDCARRYLKIVLFSHLFSHLAFGFSALMRSEGSARSSMMCMVVGFGSNVILDPFFIFGPSNPVVLRLFGRSWSLPGLDMGIEGAAWATNIAMFASFAYAAWHFTSGRAVVRLRLSRIRFYRGLIAKPCGIGFAPFLQQLLGSVINLALSASFSKWAEDEASATAQVASLGVFQSVLILTLMPVLGAQQGIQPIIGYNWGARNFKRVRSAAVSGFWITSAICVLACFVQVVPPFPRILASMFVPAGNTALLDLATHDLILSNCMIWCIGLNIVATTYFQSIGHPATAIFLSSMRQGVVMLPIVWLLPHLMKDHAFAIWLSMPVSDVVCCLMTAVPAYLHLKFLASVRERAAISVST